MHQKVAADLAVSVSDYPHIPESLTLIEALRVIKLRGWEMKTWDGRIVIPRAILVFNKRLEFVGMLRRRDIMRGLMPGFVTGTRPKLRQTFTEVEIDPNVTELSYDRFNERIRERAANRLVKEVMIPITTINHDDHLVKAIHQMVKFNTSRLAVVHDDKVIGVLRSVDILREVEKLLGILGDEDAGDDDVD